jgi:16S rRNA (guanine966-N2)-methyltransferase
VPPGRSTRPTSDRAREGLFGAVTASLGGLDGARVLDLFAGSGAVGLESLSRGAADVLMVESDPRAARVIRENITAIGLPGARLVTDRADRALARGPGGTTRDFVFADPPYAVSNSDIERILAALVDHAWLAPGALVVVERAARSDPLTWPAGYLGDRCRRYGEAVLWYGHAGGPDPAGAHETGA